MSQEVEISIASCRICFKEDETVNCRLSRLHKSIIFKITQIHFIDGHNVPPNMCKDCLNRLLEANYFRDLLLEANRTFEYLVPVKPDGESKEGVIDKKVFKNEQITMEIMPDQTVLGNDDVPEVSEEQEVEVLVPEYDTGEVIKMEEEQRDDFACCMCTFVFNSEDDLRFHVQTEHVIQQLTTEPELNQCRLCCCYFGNEEDLYNHKTCEHCFECFAANEDLLEHLKIHEVDLVEEQAVEVARQLEQEEQDQKFTRTSLSAEKRKTHKSKILIIQDNEPQPAKRRIDRADINKLPRVPNTFPCCICPTNMTSENDRANHMYESHEILTDVKNEENFRHCVYCNRQFERIDQYYGHFEVPIRKLNRCAKCGRNFLTPELLQQHDQNIHTTDTPTYNCQACKLTFGTANAYYSHNHRHHTTKPKYKCDICGDMLITPSKLKEHRNVHLNIKDFVCSICSKTFIRKDNLRNHLRTHTGAKPYKCDYCSKSFGHYTDMKRHRYIHTGEYPFKCTDCGKGFVKQAALDTHIKFTKGKPHENKSRHRDQIISISEQLEEVVENTEISEMKDSYQIVLVDQDSEVTITDNES